LQKPAKKRKNPQILKSRCFSLLWEQGVSSEGVLISLETNYIKQIINHFETLDINRFH
jgi:hypothetical protein